MSVLVPCPYCGAPMFDENEGCETFNPVWVCQACQLMFKEEAYQGDGDDEQLDN
jgi:hypothetical protein